jgi:hypothetical protein
MATGTYSVKDHLTGIDAVVKDAYRGIVREMRDYNPNIRVNPTDEYISLQAVPFGDNNNFAYFFFRHDYRQNKDFIQLRLNIEEVYARRQLGHHTYRVKMRKSFRESFHGPCVDVRVYDKKHLAEVISACKKSYRYQRKRRGLPLF